MGHGRVRKRRPQRGQRFEKEDQRDQACEDLVGEPREPAHECADVQRCKDDENERSPQSYPRVDGKEGQAQALTLLIDDDGADQHGPGATQDDERLPGQQAVDDSANAGGHQHLRDANGPAGAFRHDAAEGDCRRQAREEHEADGAQGLGVEAVSKVTQVVRKSALQVPPHTAEELAGGLERVLRRRLGGAVPISPHEAIQRSDQVVGVFGTVQRIAKGIVAHDARDGC